MVCLPVHPYWGQKGNKQERGKFLLLLILLSMKSETSVNWLHLTPAYVKIRSGTFVPILI